MGIVRYFEGEIGQFKLRNYFSPMRILILLLFCSTLHSQSAVWQNFGPNQSLETAAKLCLDPSGNIYYLANGDTNQYPGNKWQLYKLDPQGQVLWKKVYGTTGNYAASQIIFLHEKLFVAGERSWNDTNQAWVTVLDTAGVLLQEKRFGSGDTTLAGQDIAANPLNQIALLNQMRSQSGAEQSAQVLILDTALNILHRHVQIDSLSFVAQEIIALPSGGWAYTSDYELPTRFDYLVSKIDNQGHLDNRKIVSSGFTRGGNAIGVNSKGQIAIGGEGASALSVYFDITLTLLDTNLNVLSDVFVQPGVVKNDACFDMAITPYDTYLFTGYRIAPENGQTEMIVVESDSAGKQLFIDSHSSSPTCIGSGLICNDQGQFFAAGSDFNQAPSLILALGQAKGLQLKSNYLPPISAYPNPSKGVFHISRNLNSSNWKVQNVLGQNIEFELNSKSLTIPGPPGIYFLTSIKTGESLRLIIE